MGFLLHVVLLVLEGSFLVWSIVSKRIHSEERSIVKIAVLMLLAILFVTKVLEWRLCYIALLTTLIIQSLIGMIRLIRKKEKSYKLGRAILIFVRNCIIFLLVIFPVILFPEHEDIETTGIYDIATAKYRWIDESRIEEFSDLGKNRAVTVEFWYPENTNDTYPLVVFSHGAFGHINSNYSTYMELASNGYVVASIGHTYHAFFNIDTEGKLTTANRDFINSVYEMNELYDEKYAEVVYNTTREWLKLRVEDENFILNTTLKNANTSNNKLPFSIINTNSIGLIGHSLGGASSAQLGRERDDIDCVINLDGTMLGEWTSAKDREIIFNDIPYPVPLLNVYSQSTYASAMAGDEDAYTNFYADKNAICSYEVLIEESVHLNLTDLPLVSPILAKKLGTGTVDTRYCIETINEIVLEFFDCYLKDGGIPKFEEEY